MENLNLNFKLAFNNPRHRMIFSCELLTFGFRQFLSSRRIQKIHEFRALCESVNENGSPSIDLVQMFIFDQLMDCIKITLCLESFLKAFLLAKGYLIHKIDKNVFLNLYQDQFKFPIPIRSMQDIKDFEKNELIETKKDVLEYPIYGILKNTLGMKELLSKGYQNFFGISDSYIELFRPIVYYRNNLHLYTIETLAISKGEFEDLKRVIKFFNFNVVKLQNIISEELDYNESKKLKPFEYNT